MPRNKARPSAGGSGGGDSSFGLILSLVVFVLISLVLAFFLYQAQEKIDQATKAAESAKAESKKAQDNLTQEQAYYEGKFRSWIDPGDMNEQDRLTMLDAEKKLRGAEGDKRYPWFQTLAKALEGDEAGADAAAKGGLIGPIDPNTGTPKTTLRKRLDDQAKENKALADNFAAKQAELETLNKQFTDYKAQWNEKKLADTLKDQIAKHEQQIKTLEAQNAEAKKNYDTALEGVKQEMQKALADQQKKLNDELEKERRRVTEAEEKLVAATKEIRDRNTAKKLSDLDAPKGKVVRVDNNGASVYVNLGSNQHVPPQLTLAVYGRGPGGKVLSEPKAKLELVNVLGPTLSLFRVTAMAKPADIRAENDPDAAAFWITDPSQFYRSRNPILADDLLYNPAWDPNKRIHVALVGAFDLDGDGQDDIDALNRMLREMNVIIDALPNPREGYKVDGALTYQTDFLIVGSAPPTGARVASKDNRTEFESEARRRGIEVLRLQKFLDRIGYSAIRVPTPKAGPAAPAPAAPAVDAPEKKDGDKKEEK
jgi:type II secretory pathway pseudopilin PulG